MYKAALSGFLIISSRQLLIASKISAGLGVVSALVSVFFSVFVMNCFDGLQSFQQKVDF